MSASVSNLKISSEEPTALQQPPATETMRGPEVAASPSDPEMLRKLYAALLRCCMVEERAAQLARLHQPTPPGRIPNGLEATTVGSLMELRAGDAVASNLGYAARMFGGQPLGLYFAGLCGLGAEYLAFAPQAANTSIHILPQARTFAAQLNAAAGFALALTKSQPRSVVLVHLLDGADALGYWHEAAALAASERLPLIFVAINHSVKPDVVGSSDARQRALTYGIPGITVDGGDLVAMWRVTQESIYRARAGAGPTLIDSQVPSVATNSHHLASPLARMQHYLEQRKLWQESWKEELVQAFAAEVSEAEAFFAKAEETQ